MKNRFAALVLAGLAVGSAGSVASANFIFSNVRTPIVVNGSNYDRITVFARNDGTGYSAGGVRLLAMELTAGSTGAIRFQANAFNSSNTTQEANALTATSADIAAGVPTTTRVLGELFTAQLFGLFADDPHQNPDGSFYVLGTDLTSGNHGILANASVNGGKGAAFLSMITAPGSTVSLSGGIAGETGTGGGLSTMDGAEFHAAALTGGLGLNPFSYTATAPEPTTLLSLGAIAFTGARRSRRAIRG